MHRRLTIFFVLAIISLFFAGQQALAGDPKMSFTTKSAAAKAYLEQAFAKIDNQQIPEARELVTKALQADSTFALAHHVAGTIAQSQPAGKNHFEKAMALATNASEGERLYIEALAARRAGDNAKAAEMLAALSKMAPGERRVFFDLAQTQFNLKQYDAALASLQTASTLDPVYIQAYTLRANAYMMKADFFMARKIHYEALRLMPQDRNNIGAHYGVANSFLYENQPDSALAALDRGLADYKVRMPQGVPVNVWNSKGRINLENGRYDEAMKCYEMGYSLVPGSNLSVDEKMLWLGRLHHGKGRTLAQMGKHAEAWAHADTIKGMIEAAGEKGKEYWPRYHYLAGYLRLESGDYAQALDHLQHAEQDDYFIKLLLARAYEATGEKDKARVLLEEIVTLPEPGLERALVYHVAKSKLSMYSAK
jgi:Tfp pilus assembly protein PilF